MLNFFNKENLAKSLFLILKLTLRIIVFFYVYTVFSNNLSVKLVYPNTLLEDFICVKNLLIAMIVFFAFNSWVDINAYLGKKTHLGLKFLQILGSFCGLGSFCSILVKYKTIQISDRFVLYKNFFFEVLYKVDERTFIDFLTNFKITGNEADVNLLFTSSYTDLWLNYQNYRGSVNEFLAETILQKQCLLLKEWGFKNEEPLSLYDQFLVFYNNHSFWINTSLVVLGLVGIGNLLYPIALNYFFPAVPSSFSEQARTFSSLKADILLHRKIIDSLSANQDYSRVMEITHMAKLLQKHTVDLRSIKRSLSSGEADLWDNLLLNRAVMDSIVKTNKLIHPSNKAITYALNFYKNR